MAQVNRKFRFEEEQDGSIAILPLCELCDEVTDLPSVWLGKANHKIFGRITGAD